MNKFNKHMHFDYLENKIVFKVSRTIFMIISFLSILAIVISIFIFFYTKIPPKKEIIIKKEYPTEPVSFKEIWNSWYEDINSMDAKFMQESQKRFEKGYTGLKSISKKEEKKNQLELSLDSLGQLFPNYWESSYETIVLGRDYFNKVTESKRVLIGEGRKKKLLETINRCQQENTKLQIVRDILNFIKKEGNNYIGDQLTLFDTYLQILNKKLNIYDNFKREIDSEYENQRVRAETQFIESKIEKDLLESRSIMIFGISIISLALMGLNLSFLAIERNTRSIKELISYRGDDGDKK